MRSYGFILPETGKMMFTRFKRRVARFARRRSPAWQELRVPLRGANPGGLEDFLHFPGDDDDRADGLEKFDVFLGDRAGGFPVVAFREEFGGVVDGEHGFRGIAGVTFEKG